MEITRSLEVKEILPSLDLEVTVANNCGQIVMATQNRNNQISFWANGPEDIDSLIQVLEEVKKLF